MNFQPVRLHPGADIRRALIEMVATCGAGPAFLVSGIGSLVQGHLRFAGKADETVIPGPLEIISISGSVTSDGAHLHVVVSDANGQVVGGHLGFGNIVRTTLEALVVFLPDWALTREPDAATGFDELVIAPR